MKTKYDNRKNVFASPEDFISRVHKDGRGFDLLSTLLHMEETINDAQKKTIVNIFLQPTHALTVKSLKRIVNKDFPGQGANYLMKTIWYNQAAINLSKRVYTILLIILLLCISLFTMWRCDMQTLPYLGLFRIDRAFAYSLLFLSLSFVLHLVCYWNVLFVFSRHFIG
jgi:hypothetical protein